MNLRESVGIALGSIRANKLRSFLTLLGTIIGVASVIAVVSFVEGMNQFVSNKLLNAGANVLYVDKFGLILDDEAFENAMSRPDVTLADGDAIARSSPHVAMVVAEAGSVAPVRHRNKLVRNVELRGRSPGYDVVSDLKIGSGRHLADQDDLRRQSVCVIGPELAEELFANLDPIGRRVRVGSHDFEIVGVTALKGKMFGQSQDRFLLVPIRTFQKFWMERGSLALSVKSVDQSSLALAEQETRNAMRAARNLRPGQPDNFGITTAEAFMELYRTLTGGIFFVTIGVAAISMIVGGIVIMNIMLVSVTERTREIGVRKALGARRRDVLTQFLVESTTLSLTGGLIGIGLGAGLALLVGAVSPLPAAISLPAVVLGIVMSTLVGVFFGSYPAARAARLDPIEALRYE